MTTEPKVTQDDREAFEEAWLTNAGLKAEVDDHESGHIFAMADGDYTVNGIKYAYEGWKLQRSRTQATEAVGEQRVVGWQFRLIEKDMSVVPWCPCSKDSYEKYKIVPDNVETRELVVKAPPVATERGEAVRMTLGGLPIKVIPNPKLAPDVMEFRDTKGNLLGTIRNIKQPAPPTEHGEAVGYLNPRNGSLISLTHAAYMQEHYPTVKVEHTEPVYKHPPQSQSVRNRIKRIIRQVEQDFLPDPHDERDLDINWIREKTLTSIKAIEALIEQSPPAQGG